MAIAHGSLWSGDASSLDLHRWTWALPMLATYRPAQKIWYWMSAIYFPIVSFWQFAWLYLWTAFGCVQFIKIVRCVCTPDLFAHVWIVAYMHPSCCFYFFLGKYYLTTLLNGFYHHWLAYMRFLAFTCFCRPNTWQHIKKNIYIFEYTRLNWIESFDSNMPDNW